MSVFQEFCAAGLWPGVGPSVTQALLDAGIDRPQRVTQAALAALSSITDKRAAKLYTAWLGATPLYELAGLLLPHDLPIRWARRLADQLGDAAAAGLAADPWQLLVLPDATVTQADRFARSVQPDVQARDPRRLRALAARVLGLESRSGHTVSPVTLVAAELARHGLGSQGDVQAAIAAGVDAGLLRRTDGPGGPAEASVALETLAAAEDAVARHLRRLQAAATPLASAKAAATASGLDDRQRGAVIAAAQHGVSVLTGGPGTGKSRTVTAVVQLARSSGVEIVVAAPTGRAAKRLTELLAVAHGPATAPAPGDDTTADGGADLADGDDTSADQAMTIHRLLGARPGAGGVGSTFEHDAANPVEADIVVVDETSMLDAELAAALLAAIPDGSHLLLVGDPAQLPSIGAGRVLGDILAAGAFPVTELTTLYRQAAGGAIARLAASVRAGELTAPGPDGHEVVVVPAAGSVDAAHRVTQLVTDSIPRVIGLPPDGIQVVTPVHGGPAGTKALNATLKTALNPGPHHHTVRGFDVGDRVVATANHFDAEPTGYANGEIGTVIDARSGSLLVSFTGGQAEISGKALGDLQHGWAITVHRAQGSEWDAVVAVFPPEAGRMLSRPLIYTALTRARRHLSAVHAAGPALAHAVRRVGARPRRTRLAAILAENVVIPDS